jgi:protein-ribulosamine 3-kinase
MDFMPVDNVLPEPEALCSQIATIHRDSVSPTRQFGFSILQHPTITSQTGLWDMSWMQVFRDMLSRLCELESDKHGPWLADYPGFSILLRCTIPSLLSPLQSDGRKLKPCLVHGNLSISNIGVNVATGDPVLFSPASLYAHNEFELGAWRLVTEPLDLEYFREYRRHFPPSEPVEQWDDRIRLYSIKFNLAHLLLADIPQIQKQ